MTPDQLQALLDYIDARADAAREEAEGRTPSRRSLDEVRTWVWFTFEMEPPQ